MVKSFRLSIVNRYNSQKGVRYVNKRLLDLLRKARSLKKKIVLYLTKVLLSVSACALSDRRYIALLCTYIFSVLLLHRCVLFVFPLSLYHSQRTSTPRVCMSISVGNRRDGIFLFCVETHSSVLFVVTPSSCCPYNVQSERLLQVSACAFLGRASTRMPTVHSSKFCFHIVAVCLWSRRPCHVHR